MARTNPAHGIAGGFFDRKMQFWSCNAPQKQYNSSQSRSKIEVPAGMGAQ
jgi:hypothetical protein